MFKGYRLLILLAAILVNMQLAFSQSELPGSVLLRPLDNLTIQADFAKDTNPLRTDIRIAFVHSSSKSWIVSPVFVAPDIMKFKIRNFFPIGNYRIAVGIKTKKKLKEIQAFSATIIGQADFPAVLQTVTASPGDNVELGPISPSLKASQIDVSLNGTSVPFKITEGLAARVSIPQSEKLRRRVLLEAYLKLKKMRVLLATTKFDLVNSSIPYISVEAPVTPETPGIVSIVVPPNPSIPNMPNSHVKMYIKPGAKVPELIEAYSGKDLVTTIRHNPKTGERNIRDPHTGGGYNIKLDKDNNVATLDMVIPNSEGEEEIFPILEADLMESGLAESLEPVTPSPTPNPGPNLNILPALELKAKDCMGSDVGPNVYTRAAYEITRVNSNKPWVKHAPVEVPLELHSESRTFKGLFPTLFNSSFDYAQYIPQAALLRENLGSLENATEFMCDWGGLASVAPNPKKIKLAKQAEDKLEEYLSKYYRGDNVDKAHAALIRSAIYAKQKEQKELTKQFLYKIEDKMVDTVKDDLEKVEAKYLDNNSWVLKQDAVCQNSGDPLSCVVRPMAKLSRSLDDLALAVLSRDPIGVVCVPLKYKYDVNDKESGFFGTLRHILSPIQLEFDSFKLTPVLYRGADRLSPDKRHPQVRYTYPLRRLETGYSDRWLHAQTFDLGNHATACPVLKVKNETYSSGFDSSLMGYLSQSVPINLGLTKGTGFSLYHELSGQLWDFTGTKQLVISTGYKPTAANKDIEVKVTTSDVFQEKTKKDIAILTDSLPVMNCELSRPSRNEIPKISCSDPHGLYMEWTWESNYPLYQYLNPLSTTTSPQPGGNPFADFRGGGVASRSEDGSNGMYGQWFIDVPKDSIELCVYPQYPYYADIVLKFKLKVYRDGERIFSDSHTFRVGDNTNCWSENGGWRLSIPTGGAIDWTEIE